MSFSTDDLTVVFVAVTESVPVADLTDDNVGVMIAVKTTALALEKPVDARCVFGGDSV